MNQAACDWLKHLNPDFRLEMLRRSLCCSKRALRESSQNRSFSASAIARGVVASRPLKAHDVQVILDPHRALGNKMLTISSIVMADCI